MIAGGRECEPRRMPSGRYHWLYPCGDWLPEDEGPWMPPGRLYDLLQGGDDHGDWRSYATREEAVNDLTRAVKRAGGAI